MLTDKQGFSSQQLLIYLENSLKVLLEILLDWIYFVVIVNFSSLQSFISQKPENVLENFGKCSDR